MTSRTLASGRTQTFHREHGRTDRHNALGEHSREFAARHQPDQCACIGPGGIAGLDRFAVTQYGDAVRDAAQFFETMRNINNAGAAFPEPAYDFEKAVRLALRKRSGGLIQNQYANVSAQCLGDLDELLFRHRKRARYTFGIDLRADRLDQLFGAPPPGRPVHSTKKAARFVHQCNVFGHGEIGKDGGLLINRRNPHLPRAMRRVVFENRAIELNGARIRLHRARKNANERALPRPVFSDQRMHFTGSKVERNVLQRAYAAVAFLDAGGLKEQTAIILAT